MMIVKLYFLVFAVAFCSASLSEPWKDYRREKGKEPKWKNSVIDYVKGSIWPKPQVYNATKIIYSLIPSEFSFASIGETSDVLTDALSRYKSLVFPDPNEKLKAGLQQITKLSVKVEEKYAPQSIRSDESYTLVVEAPASSLTAKSVWGALRGLETFSQVVHQDEVGFYLANGSSISDYPRFQHRGFMIDTSRHYLDISVILKFIEALSYNKFNVLHWHIVDTQSFPFVSESFPELSGQGAFNNKTHIYTKKNVSTVIEYGRMHGVRVIPEFDTPGHTLSWGSIKDLLTPCYSKGVPSGKFGPFNPTLDSTYTFLKTFFSEIAQRFPDQYLHLGGDEVNEGCWASNPDITAWMQKMGFGKNYSLLEQYYEQNLLKIVAAHSKSYIIWQDVIDNEVKVLPDTVVNIWKTGWKKEMGKVTSKGLRAILSSCWYLNRIHFGDDWTPFYTCDPTNFTGSTEQKKLVLGGTGCMWGEYVDGTNLLPRTWPRAFAVGERLWSSKDTTDLKDADMRLWEHRCRYIRRGIPTEPVLKYRYCRYEWKFD
ncbi:beta-hexosaminidase subunit beta-like [Acropora millepora]|uniref:beta-hexosaminidase subunit beta-like n=1 Tax=Acropora millepora TaxID=45264 RepID=UPI001CF2057D|nr:beta-hexosaminidase subunit beta-like [Acropora millepora]